MSKTNASAADQAGQRKINKRLWHLSLIGFIIGMASAGSIYNVFSAIADRNIAYPVAISFLIIGWLVVIISTIGIVCNNPWHSKMFGLSLTGCFIGPGIIGSGIIFLSLMGIDKIDYFFYIFLIIGLILLLISVIGVIRYNPLSARVRESKKVTVTIDDETYSGTVTKD